jgi:hypothetical protein
MTALFELKGFSTDSRFVLFVLPDCSESFLGRVEGKQQ